MAQPESIERFSQFQAARAATQVATDPDYEPLSGIVSVTSGTGISAELAGVEFAEVRYCWTITGEQDDVSALTIYSDDITFVASGDATGFRFRGDSSIKVVIDPIVGEVSALSAIDFTPVFIASSAIEPSGQPAQATDDLAIVVDYARKHGLKKVAARLVEINKEPLDSEEVTLQFRPAMNFVRYCIARKKQSRPLMTVTPTGELDATWKGPDGYRVVMRFFQDGSVWVAYKLTKVKGSFQVDAVDDLLDLKAPIQIPDWA